eukprot:GHVU01094297.1.p1 GENE.GHVU01094297.1~~GHVU01094297.1.p1  ORF type:complete len:109 (+),score=0.79 GHVU01094297.1:107-433(+)
MHTSTHRHTHTCTHMHTYTHTQTYTHTYIYIHIRVRSFLSCRGGCGYNLVARAVVPNAPVRNTGPPAHAYTPARGLALTYLTDAGTRTYTRTRTRANRRRRLGTSYIT